MSHGAVAFGVIPLGGDPPQLLPASAEVTAPGAFTRGQAGDPSIIEERSPVIELVGAESVSLAGDFDVLACYDWVEEEGAEVSWEDDNEWCGGST